MAAVGEAIEEVEVSEQEQESSLAKERAERRARLQARQEAALKRQHALEASTSTASGGEDGEESYEDGVEDDLEEEEEEEVRESMVENAVKFLSNESVKKTPLVRRVAFLEKKGLTQAEITTAMQRVSGASEAPAKKATKKKKVVRKVVYEDDDDDDDAQVVVVRKGARPVRQAAPPPLPPPPPVEKERWTWKSLATTTFVALGAIGGLVALAKAVLPAPRGKEGRQQQERLDEERAPGQQTPVGSRGMFSADQSPYSTPQHQQAYGRAPGTPQYNPKTPAQQVEELKDQMSELVKAVHTQQSTLQKVQNVLNTPRATLPSSTAQELESIDVNELKSAISQLQQLLADSRSPARMQAAPTAAPSRGSVPMNGGSAPQAMASAGSGTPLQRTATPAAITPISGGKAQGAGAPSYLATTNHSPSPVTKGAKAQPAYTSKYAASYGTPPSAKESAAPVSSQAVEPASSQEAKASPAGYSKSFMDVMNMVQRGEEVPGIRTDIDDSPADPEQVVQTGTASPPPKPWETRLKARQQRFARPAASPAPSYLSPQPKVEDQTAESDEEAESDERGPKVEDITESESWTSSPARETKLEEPEQ